MIADKYIEQAVRELGALLLRPSRHYKPRRMRPQRSVANGISIRKRASNEAARARPEIEDRAQTRIDVKRGEIVKAKQSLRRAIELNPRSARMIQLERTLNAKAPAAP